MNHLSEEQLIELYYSDHGPEAALHLDSCAHCASAYAALQTDLADMKPLNPPQRGDAYGQQVWESIAALLPMYATGQPTGQKTGQKTSQLTSQETKHPETRRWFRRPLWLGLGAATACALLLAAFFAGRAWEHHQPQAQSATVVRPAVTAPQRVVVVVLSDHLDRSERFLVQLKHASADDEELAVPLRDEARTLLAANQKCRRDAEASGDPALSQALDHLNDVLSQLANHPGGLNADAITKLQEEMDTDGLLFEVRVLRSRIPDRQASTNHHPVGGIA
jgi:hypothetical protein